MSKETEAVMVNLLSIPGKKEKKGKVQPFPIKQANEILTMKKPAWKLHDEGFSWNGTEIVKAKAKK